jgi:hypothetical protein
MSVQLPRVTVCGAGVEMSRPLVAARVAGITKDDALEASVGLAGTDVAAVGVLALDWSVTATAPAMVKNDAMLNPPSNQRAAAAG